MGFLVGEPAILARTVMVGVLAYVALVVMLRLSGKRTLSQMNAFDLIVTVALGSTLASILTSSDVTLAHGIFAFFVLIGMQFIITWSSLRSAHVARMAKSEPTVVVLRGRYVTEAMKRERLLDAEVRAALREHGIARVEDADLVVLETDGTISVVQDMPAAAWADPEVREVLPDRVEGAGR